MPPSSSNKRGERASLVDGGSDKWILDDNICNSVVEDLTTSASAEYPNRKRSAMKSDRDCASVSPIISPSSQPHNAQRTNDNKPHPHLLLTPNMYTYSLAGTFRFLCLSAIVLFTFSILYINFTFVLKSTSSTIGEKQRGWSDELRYSRQQFCCSLQTNSLQFLTLAIDSFSCRTRYAHRSYL